MRTDRHRPNQFRHRALLALASGLVAVVPLAVSPLRGHAFGPFRQDQRINQLTLQFGIDSFATQNAFGGAFGTVTQTQWQTSISSAVKSGATSLLFEMPGLVDLSGTDESSLQVGVVNGSPINPGSPYDGNSDLDWWYSPATSDLDGSAMPKRQLSGSITAHALTAAGPSVRLASAIGDDTMSSVQIAANTGALSTPLTSSGYSPPGHPASDQIDPSLQSFGSMSGGQMKGNISAESLASTPIPAAFLPGGSGSCNEGYATTNSLLDLIVAGCVVFIFRAVQPTQPDKVDPAAPVAGAGPPYHLSVNSAHVVTTCTDKNNAAVNLQACLGAAAYSAYFTFTTDRVIGKAPQTVAFTSTPPVNPVEGDSYTATATGGASGNPVVFSIDAAATLGACTVSSGGSVSFTGGGTCIVDADQAGNAIFFAAPQVSQSMTVATLVSGITPSAVGQGAKNLSVAISGSGFVAGDTPSISGTGATLSSVVVVDSTTITAKLTVAVSAAQGVRDVLVATPSAGTATCSSCLSIVAHPAPTSLSPSSLQTGATSVNVMISGTGFEPGITKVTITGPSSGVKAKNVLFVSSTQLTVKITVPSAAALGAYSVKVTNSDAGVGTCKGCLTVTQGPILGSMAPNGASRGQRINVTLTGQFFATGASVKGPPGVAFSHVVVVSATTITAVMKVSSTAPTGTNLVVTVINSAAVGSGRGSCACLTIN